MDILDKDYMNDDHVLVFDNATTHLKHKEDALSATKMSKFTPAMGRIGVLRLTNLMRTVMWSTGLMAKC